MKINRSILNIVIAAILFALIAPVMTYAQLEDTVSIEARKKKGQGKRDALRQALAAKTADVNALRAQQDGLRQQIAALNAKVGTASQKEAELKALTAKYATLESEMKTDLAAKDKLLAELKKELDLAKDVSKSKEYQDLLSRERVEFEALENALERERKLEKDNALLLGQIKKLTEDKIELEKKNKELEEENEELVRNKNQAPTLVFENAIVVKATGTAAGDIRAAEAKLTLNAYAEGASTKVSSGNVAPTVKETLNAPMIALKQSMFGRDDSPYELVINYKEYNGTADVDKEIKFKEKIDWAAPSHIIKNAAGNELFKLSYSYRGTEILVKLENK